LSVEEKPSVPMTAQDRVRKAPLGALLFLLGLFLASGAAASSASDPGEPLARLGTSRQATTTALLQSGNRNSPDDDGLATGDGSSVPPSGPGVVTQLLWARPLAAPAPAPSVALPRRASASYRARAPPAA
jgi:hypothetical protein